MRIEIQKFQNTPEEVHHVTNQTDKQTSTPSFSY